MAQHCPCRHPCPLVPCNSVLMRHGTPFRFSRGQTLWHGGDNADWIGVVCVGLLKFVTSDASEGGVIIDLAERGRIIGAEAALEDRKRPYTCVAQTNGRGLMVPTARAISLLSSTAGRQIFHRLLELLAESVENSTTRLPELTGGTVEVRLAMVLTRLAHRMGIKDGRGVFLPVRLTRSELAGFVSCREETVIRLMTNWERQGWVHTQPEGFSFHNLDAIEAIACPPSLRETG